MGYQEPYPGPSCSLPLWKPAAYRGSSSRLGRPERFVPSSSSGVIRRGWFVAIVAVRPSCGAMHEQTVENRVARERGEKGKHATRTCSDRGRRRKRTLRPGRDRDLLGLSRGDG